MTEKSICLCGDLLKSSTGSAPCQLSTLFENIARAFFSKLKLFNCILDSKIRCRRTHILRGQAKCSSHQSSSFKLSRTLQIVVGQHITKQCRSYFLVQLGTFLCFSGWMFFGHAFFSVRSYCSEKFHQTTRCCVVISCFLLWKQTRLRPRNPDKPTEHQAIKMFGDVCVCVWGGGGGVGTEEDIGRPDRPQFGVVSLRSCHCQLFKSQDGAFGKWENWLHAYGEKRQTCWFHPQASPSSILSAFHVTLCANMLWSSSRPQCWILIRLSDLAGWYGDGPIPERKWMVLAQTKPNSQRPIFNLRLVSHAHACTHTGTDTDRQTDRQTDRHTHTHTHARTHTYAYYCLQVSLVLLVVLAICLALSFFSLALTHTHTHTHRCVSRQQTCVYCLMQKNE